MKNRLDQYKRLFRYGFVILLVLGQALAFLHCWMTRYNDIIVLPFVQKGHWLIALYYILFEMIFLYSFDGLKFDYFRKTNIFISQVLAILCTNVMMYLQIVLLAAEFVTVVPMLVVTVFNIAFAIGVSWLSIFVFHRCFPARKLLVIYDEYEPDQMVKKLNSRRDKYKVEMAVHVSVGMDELEKMIDASDGVVIFDVHSEQRNRILKVCFDKNVRTYTTTKVSDILIRGAENIHLFDTPLLLYRNEGLTFEQRLIKRAMDIIISGLMLIITSPFMLISALAIKLYDGGPVFFRQDRSTIGGRVFKIHKFRSMIVDAEQDGKSHPATEKDPRITPVGRVLRATRLDELPQLIDILKGDMSLVGPRPERVEHTEQYSKEVPEFQYRLKVRGGLTGYAQLYGKYNTTPYDKLQLDLMYIQNYSVLLDLRLLFMTVKIMFMKESVEGFTEEESRNISGAE